VFQRFPIAADDIVIGDRGYARHTGLRAVRDAGADFLVRAGWRTQRLRDVNGASMDLAEVYQQAAAKGLLERRVVIEEPLSKGPGIGARMIVLPKSAAQSDRSRLRVVHKNRKKGRRTHPMSLVAADYLVLLTTLDAENYPADRVIALYRMRWQIELAFKRLKSLIGIHKLPARDPDLARAWLAAHLIVALLIDAGTGKVLDSPPARQVNHSGPSIWRVHKVLHSSITTAVAGIILTEYLLLRLARTIRHFCDPPRRRPAQALTARHLLPR
jgi:hypothetical protein